MCVKLGDRMGENRRSCRSAYGLIAGVLLTAAAALSATKLAGAQVRPDRGGQHVTCELD